MSFSGENACRTSLSAGVSAEDTDTSTKYTVMTWPRISVVVPIRNEERFIAKTLSYILKQDYPEDCLEVLVVDGESTDRSADIVREIAATDPRVRLLTNPKRLSSAGRALGAEQAGGDVITFIDGHVYIDNPYLLKNTAQLLQEKRVAVLSRPQFLETPENNRFQQAVALARRSIIGHGLESTIYESGNGYVDPSSSGATYRRDVFRIVGNFDDRFDACEDVEFNHRVAVAGFRSYTSMQLAVHYYPRESLMGLFRQLVRYGKGRFRLARKHRETLSLGTLIPFAFVFGSASLALLGLLWQPIWYLAAGLVGAYLLLTIGASAILAAKHGWQYLVLLPQIFWAIHVGLGWGFGVELLRTLTGRAARFSD